MIDCVLKRKNVCLKNRIAIKSTIMVALIVCAVVLPQIVHASFGAKGGMTFLPMYLPVLLGGCILGYKLGLCLGILSPLVSYLLTCNGVAMPGLERLPFMMVELSVFAVVAGLFSKKINDNAWFVLPAICLAQILGRASFLLTAIAFGGDKFSLTIIFSQIKTGLVGLLIQLILVSVVTVILHDVLNKDVKNK